MRKLVAAAAMCLALTAPVHAQTEADAQAVFELAGALKGAWESGDASGLALLFSYDGEMVLPRGLRLVGPAAIRDGHAGVFATIYQGTTLDITDAATRFPTPDVAILRFNQLINAAPGTEPQGSAGQTLLSTLVARRADEGWLIEYLDAIPAAPADFALPTAPAPEAASADAE